MRYSPYVQYQKTPHNVLKLKKKGLAEYLRNNIYQTAPSITYAVVKKGSEYKIKFRNKTEFIFNENGLLVKKQDYCKYSANPFRCYFNKLQRVIMGISNIIA